MPTDDSKQTAISVAHVSKEYPGVLALDDVSLTVTAGSIHGLVGENGAGKSTLMKTVAGAIEPDAGEIMIRGARTVGDLRRAADAGIAMIYQELTIVPELSALENVLLGCLPERFGVVDRRRARDLYSRVARLVGTDIRPGARAGGLSTSSQQLLEIMRALASGRNVLIMDEPTASLGPEDTDRLHAVMRDLRGQGMAVVYISHDLDAVLGVCDTVTVMREGRVVETRPSREWSTGSLISAMIGAVPLATAGRAREDVAHRPVLTVRGLRAPGVRVDSLDVLSGEIVGLAGLVGSGRTRMLRAIAGADAVSSGSLHVDGAPVKWPGSPRNARRLGVLLAPEDRKHQGLVLDREAGWNIALGQFGAAAGRRPVTRRRLRDWASRYAATVGFTAARLAAPARVLSGGNQQKLILARLLGQDARCILLDEPTRGIDIGAKAQIFETIRELVDTGRSVIWASSDLHEVAQHSDRIIVIAGGRAVAELPAGSSVRDILDHAFAASGKKAAA